MSCQLENNSSNIHICVMIDMLLILLYNLNKFMYVLLITKKLFILFFFLMFMKIYQSNSLSHNLQSYIVKYVVFLEFFLIYYTIKILKSYLLPHQFKNVM